MADDKPLEKMTAPELRQYARDQGLMITHLSERRKETLVRLIREAQEAVERSP